MGYKIAMISSQAPPVYGGAGQQALLLGQTLAGRGHDVSFFTLDQQHVGSTVIDGVKMKRVPYPRLVNWGERSGLRSLALALWGAYHVLRIGYQAVHIHGNYWWSLLPAVAAKVRGSVLIVKITRDGEDDPTTARNKAFHGIPVGWLYSYPFRAADHIIALNKRSVASTNASGWGEKACYLTNGVNVSAFPARRQWPSELAHDHKVRIAFLGYLVRHKGVLELVSAFIGMSDTDVELSLIGPLRGDYRELDESVALQLEAAEAAAKGRIKIAGHVSPNDAVASLIASDIFCLPSHVEGMPNSLLEAEAAGCLIVASRIPGIEELDDGSFFLHEAGDTLGLRAALERAVETVRKRIRKPMNPSRHSVATLAEIYEALYAQARR